MKKKNRYITVGISLMFIALLVAIYSTYTYSVGQENNQNYYFEVDETNFIPLSIGEERFSVNDYTTTLDINSNSNNEELPSSGMLQNIPVNRTQEGGTCWAVSSINALESTIANTGLDSAYGDTKRINPYHMVYTLERKLGINEEKNLYGYRIHNEMNGANPLNVLLYLSSGRAFTTDSLFHMNSGSSQIDTSITLNNTLNVEKEEYQVKEVKLIPGIGLPVNLATENYPGNTNIQGKINDIKRYIHTGHGVTIMSQMDSTRNGTNDFYKCKEGAKIYCDKESSSFASGWHQMLIVGWDDNYSKSNFAKLAGGQDEEHPEHTIEPPANGAFIVRNSWSSPDLIYISYYDYAFIVRSNIVVTSIEEKNYDNLYQYNPSGCKTKFLDSGNYEIKDYKTCNELITTSNPIVNIYTKNTEGVEKLKSIGLYAKRKNSTATLTKATIYFKEGETLDSSLFNEENKIGEINTPTNGFYTYDLEEEINITSNKFIIGIKPTNIYFGLQGKSNPLLTNEEVGIKEGVSYWQEEETFVDLSQFSEDDTTDSMQPATAFIKAYTISENNQASNETTYIVRHYQEKLNGEYQLKETETYNGTIGETVSPNTKTYSGFASPEKQEITLTENDNEIEYRYTRKTYSLSLTKGEGIESVSGARDYKYGESVTIDATLKPGYSWLKWVGTPTINIKKHTFTMPAKNVTYKATASLAETSCQVKHYQENLEGEYELKETETVNGAIGEIIKPEVKTYEGFESPTATQITLASSGNTITYRYRRQQYNVLLTKGIGISLVSGAGTYKYGETVTINAVTKEGYIWDKWQGVTSITSIQYTFTMPANRVVYIATAKLKDASSSEQTTYQVRHYQETLTGEYELKEEETGTGTIGESITPKIKSYKGFQSPNTKELVLTANKNIIEYKYTRITYTLNLKTSEGISSVNGAKSYKYGESVTIDAQVASGYTWKEWEGNPSITSKRYTFNMPAYNVTYKAVATKNNNDGDIISGIEISPKEQTMYVGDKLDLSYKFIPEEITSPDVSWISSNNSIATVTNGTVEALKEGTVRISVTYGDFSDFATITIKNKTNNDSLKDKILLNYKSMSISTGEGFQLKAEYTGNNDSNIIWSSSDETIATVENGLVKGIAKGVAIITAKLEGTRISATCTVDVKSKEETEKATKSVDLNVNDKDGINLHETATDEEVEYIIENEEIATVENGVIKGLKSGKTKVKVIVNGVYTEEAIINVQVDSLEVTVQGYDLGFNESKHEYELKIGKEETLIITANKDVSIEGNEKLKNKSIIKIKDKDTNEEYTIKIIKKTQTTSYIFLGIAIVISILVLMKIIKTKKEN